MYFTKCSQDVTRSQYCSQTAETMTDMTSNTGMEITPYIVDSVASTATVE